MLYSYIKKLHVSAGSGHHQVLSFDSLKMYYHVVHPHTQYSGTTLQQGFWGWDLLIKHAATRNCI